MSRLNPSDIFPTESAIPNSLDKLIVAYGMDKAELKMLTERTETINAEIKKQMSEANETEHEADGWVAKCSETNRESMNEVRLLDIVKKHKIPDVVKTKEYVDMDALEKYLYNNCASSELVSDLNSCRIVQKVVTLRVSKKKPKKGE